MAATNLTAVPSNSTPLRGQTSELIGKLEGAHAVLDLLCDHLLDSDDNDAYILHTVRLASREVDNVREALAQIRERIRD